MSSFVRIGHLPRAIPVDHRRRRRIPPLRLRIQAAAFENEDETLTPIAQTGKLKGSVKWFDSKKGFGFIQPDDGGEDVFTSILCTGYRALRNGELVEYELNDDDDGRKRASQVTGPDGAQPLGAGMEDPYLDSGNYETGRYASEAFTGMGRFSSGLQVVIHNLPWSVTSDQLLDVFSEYGAVEAKIQIDDMGRSRGYGIVKFDDKENAERAIEEMHMMELDGRNITVRFDRFG